MARAPVFYGWWVALAFSVMIFLSTGVRFAVGPFLEPMVADLGTLLLGGATAATGLVTTLWQLSLVSGVLVALGLTACGQVVASAVIARWFTRRRATALSFLGAASMAGMSLLVPVAMWCILTVGWRVTYGLAGALLVVVLLPLSLWVVRDQPWMLLALAVGGGVTMSGTLAMTSALTADLFGRFSVGSVFGMIFFIHQAGAAIGSSLGGVLFEATSGYGAAFTVACVLLLGACALSLTIQERFTPLPYPHPVAGGR